MMDRFSPTFSKFFCPDVKSPKKLENSNFLHVRLTLFLSSRVFLSGIKMGVNVVCTLFFTGNHNISIS